MPPPAAASGGSDPAWTRPRPYDVVCLQNDRAYGSFAPTASGGWMGALFASRDLEAGELIAPYTGPLLTRAEAAASTSHYLFSARDARDRRRRVVIDGHPKHGNLAGFANYATHARANAEFVDAAGEGPAAAASSRRTNIQLRARAPIPAGTEIRVDYDRGVAGRPFYEQMLAEGATRASLTTAAYKRRRWAYPGGGACDLKEGRAAAGARCAPCRRQ